MKFAKIILLLFAFVAGIHNGQCRSDDKIRVGKQTIQIPSSTKIAKDLVGCRFTEMNENGYFHKAGEWTILPDDKVTVKVKKAQIKNNILHYNIDVRLMLPSRGQYILNCRVGYAKQNNRWVQDYFVCDKIMPRITGQYKKFIKHGIEGRSGERSLIITNYSNVDLAVLGVLSYEYSGRNRRKFAITVKANEEKKIGGLFVGSIDTYEIHYVERK